VALVVAALTLLGALALLLVPVPGGLPSAVAAEATGSPEPTQEPEPTASSVIPLPTRTPTRPPTAVPTETAEPTEEPRPTATRTRVRTTPRPVETEEPVVRETPDASLAPVTGGGFGVGTPSPGLLDVTEEPRASATAVAAEPTSASTGDRITRLAQLIVLAGVLLGVGGGVGLYLTRH
jgi:outer membrane biosynthesis protein TonB